MESRQVLMQKKVQFYVKQKIKSTVFFIKKRVRTIHNKIAKTEFKNQTSPAELSSILFEHFFTAVNVFTNIF